MPTDLSPDGSPADATGTGPPDTTPRHVLIVEDDEELAELLRIWTRDCCGSDARIDVAHSVADGEGVLESRSTLDVVLLDRRLPDGSGRDLLEGLTGFDAITVMITAVAPEGDIIELPVADYLVKPIDKGTLVEKLSLLEKFDAADALRSYTDARKASLLEHHLDAPEEDPLYRRFAARWSYDRLEVAVVEGRAVVYELYTGGPRAGDDEREIHVSVAGSLASAVEPLLEAGEIEPVGELLPSGDGYAWLRADGVDPIEPADGVIAIYGFACETPERYVTDDGGGVDCVELAAALESAFN